MDNVFRALADPGRRHLLDLLFADNGQTLSELSGHLDMSRQAVAKHLAILEDANLVVSVRSGRQKLHYLNPVPIHEIGERWIKKFEQPRLEALATLKRALEEETVDSPKFTYEIHIASSRNRLWQALTDADLTERFWSGNRLESSWRVGAPVRLLDNGLVRDEGEVLEFIPEQRLSYTWRPRFAIEFEGDGATPIAFAEAEAEVPTHVSFVIDQFGPQLLLKLTHEGFAHDSKLLPIVSFGWPFYMSSLKSLLETGQGLELPAGAK